MTDGSYILRFYSSLQFPPPARREHCFLLSPHLLCSLLHMENGTKATKACWFCHGFPQYIWPWDHISQRSGMEGFQMPHLKKMAHLARGSFLKMPRNLQNLECPMRRMYFQILCSSLCYLCEVLESACGHVAQRLPCLTAGHRWPPGFMEFDSGAFSLFLQDESESELPGETVSPEQ